MEEEKETNNSFTVDESDDQTTISEKFPKLLENIKTIGAPKKEKKFKKFEKKFRTPAVGFINSKEIGRIMQENYLLDDKAINGFLVVLKTNITYEINVIDPLLKNILTSEDADFSNIFLNRINLIQINVLIIPFQM